MSDLREIHFYAASKSNDFWLEIGELMAEGFSLAGIATTFHWDAYPAQAPAAGEINLAVGGHEYANLYLSQFPWAEVQDILGRMYALTGEQPGTSWFESNIHLFKNFLGAWDITATGAAALAARGIRAWHLPLGLGSSMIHEGPVTQGTDVFFMGSLTTERGEFFSGYGLQGFAHRNNIRLVELGYAKTQKDKMYMDRGQRNALVAQSRITLNIHGHLVNFFEWHRALIALANGSLFLTETSLNAKPLLAGVDYMEVSRNIIQPCIDFFLEREDLTRLFVGQAKTIVREHLSQARICEIWLKKFSQGTSTQLFDSPEFAGILSRPHDAKSEVHRELKAHIQKIGSKRFVDFYRFSNRAKPLPKTGVNMVEESQKIRSRREEVALRIAAEDQLVKEGTPYAEEHGNELWGKLGAADISVVISLYNYEQDISFALDSLLFACDHEQCKIEVIIVEDGSTDASAQVARDWMSTEALPAKLFVKKLNTGFISSRNLGIGEARGRYVFILDADNALLPMGLQRLYDLIVAKKSAAAYGIILCVDENGRPGGLLSAYAWDVNRLVYSPYVDAMALFDREKMLQLGNYDTEMFHHGWFGWEDYEYWLRLASIGESVEFHPNFCAMYRQHSTSMINSTNLFRFELASYLYRKYENFVESNSTRDVAFGFGKKMFHHQKALASSSSSSAL